jgi:hypothetical protein
MDLTLIDFKKLLIDQDLLEIKEPKWEHLKICHGNDSPARYGMKTHLEVAKSIVPDRSKGGLYAYFKGQKCIYIGKARSLQGRIHAHLLESESVWGSQKWMEFFSNRTGDLDLFTLNVSGSGHEANTIRSILELILQEHYKPNV